MIIYKCNKCERKHEWNYLNLPHNWTFFHRMDVDGGNKELLCPDCSMAYVLKHKTHGYLKRRGHSGEPSLHFTDDPQEAMQWSSQDSPLRLIDAEDRLRGSGERWTIEAVTKAL